MEPEKDKSRLETLSKNLYSRSEVIRTKKTGELSQHSYEVRDDWGDREPIEAGGGAHDSSASPIARKIFFFSLLFFVVALGLASFIYFRGVNVVSSSNIDITISGPLSIAGGQVLDLDVIIKNENNAALELADLHVEYPDGTRNPNDVTQEQRRTQDSVGTIESGQSTKLRIRSVLYGEENTKKEITVMLSYRMKGSNAVNEKYKTFEVLLTSSPITMVVNSLKEVTSDQSIEFVVDVTSNSPQLIKNVLVKSEYPFGFTYTGSDPQPYAGNSVWLIGDLKPGERRAIKVRGKVQGQDGEVRTIRFSAGVQGVKNKTALEPVFLSSVQTVTINKPFIGINLSLAGSNDAVVVVSGGQTVIGSVEWTNNLPTRVTNASISVKLNGQILNRASVKPEQGFFRSVDNTIVWDSTTNNELAQLNPGDTGRLSFTFETTVPDSSKISTFKNQEMVLEVSVKGRRVEDALVPEEVFSTVSKKLRLSSDLGLAPQITYKIGAFINNGPIPPKAEKQTTYTVVWALTNTFNDARDVKVTATLPPYVTWINAISPTEENMEFNSLNSQVVWNVGEVKAGTGFTTAPRKVQFQISFVPSLSQVNTAPILINDMTITGVDRFTGKEMRSSRNSLDTRISNDPGVKAGSEIVTP